MFLLAGFSSAFNGGSQPIIPNASSAISSPGIPPAETSELSEDEGSADPVLSADPVPVEAEESRSSASEEPPETMGQKYPRNSKKLPELHLIFANGPY